MCHNERYAYDHVLYIYNIYYICATMRGVLMIMYCIYNIYYICATMRGMLMIMYCIYIIYIIYVPQ